MYTYLFSYYIIPLLTLWLARGTQYLHSNFSTIRSAFERQLEFSLWCLITGLYFFISIRRLYQNFSSANHLPAIAAGLLLASALFPYLPEDLPVLSLLHLLTAFTSSVLLYYCLLNLSLTLYEREPALGRPALLLLIASISFCLAAWAYSGIINTAMEICLVFTACLLIRRFTLLFAK